ncbi:hypothetical protein B0J11DRAFT_544875 [Dendryphion nanum]|uniref:Subtilisin-like serine protease n=1 Tax=Dendryphion nanum TaxID=256645 RepID=A0A9P9I7M6_9PLEO|nr:hypothetical protein B0J11DRAFT_544875 [Dendryphion nanum]
MSPFSKANKFENNLDPCAAASPAASLPGHPCILLDDSGPMKKFLGKEFCSPDLEIMAPHLWIMTTLSSANINPLHRQRVKGREIIVTEEPRLHLVWIHNRIFIKPLPRYLVSQKFWEMYLDEGSDRLGESRINICKAANGFLRTYRYLIQHESDFHIAQQDSLRLVPRDMTWEHFCKLTAELDHISDSDVSKRYNYGELRLTRLNFYAPLLLRKFHFEHLHGQYGDFFGRLYGPILFVFALISIILNSMQVALSAEQLVTSHWESIWYTSRSFSMASLVGAGIISTWFVLLWLWLFLDEWVFTIKQKMKKRRERLSASSC